MSDQLSKVELKPCPFCGAAPTEHWHKGVWREHYLVHCPTRGCPARPGTNAATGNPDATTYSSKDEANCAWNRRIESAAAPVEVDSLTVDVSNVSAAEATALGNADFANFLRYLAGGELHESSYQTAFAEAARRIASLACQLAEARAENAIATSVHEHERLNFQVQLAAATRRAAEVEGLLSEVSRNGWGHLDMHDAAQPIPLLERIDAALKASK